MSGARAASIEWPFVGRVAEQRLLDQWYAGGAVGGVVLYGGSGTGKSSLARHWIASATASPNLRSVRCARALAEVPLGCLAPLVEDRATDGPGRDLVGSVERALRELARDHRVLLVEDAHWLDATSAHLLRRLVLEGATSLLLTVSTAEPTSPSLSDLVKEAAMQRLEIPPLALDEVTRVLEAGLGGPVDAELVRTVFDVSEGNPLFVRELVTASVATHAIRLDEVWTLTRPLELSTLLTDLISGRIDALSPAAQATLRLVAEGGSIELEHLLAMAAPEAIAELELAGLVQSYDDARTARYQASHALFEEMVLAHSSPSDRRAACGRLAAALEGLDRRGDGPFLEVVRWRVGSDELPRSPDLERAQGLAMAGHDFVLAAECGRILWQRFGTPEEALALADALFAMHTHDSLLELEDLLAGCQAAMSPTDERLPELIGMRALNLGVGIGKIDEATELVGEVIASVPDRAESDRLAMALGATLLYCGLPDRALEILGGVDLGRQPLGELHWCNALWMSGRLGDLGDHLRSTAPDRREPWMVSSEAATLLYLGDLRASEVRANESLSDVFVASGKDTLAHLTSHLVLGWLSMMAGQSGPALAHFDVAAAAVQGTGMAVVPLAYRAVAAAHTGDLRLARQNLLTIETLKASLHEGGAPTGGRGLDAITLYAVVLARAWVAAAEGRSRAESGSILRSAATKMGKRGERLNEAWLLHEAVCLGAVRPGDPGRLGELQAEIGGLLVPLWAAHAAALMARNVGALAAVAEKLAALGDVRGAVHAAWSAWTITLEGGQERAKNATLAQLQELVGRTDWHPSLQPPPIERHGLTTRELEIARLAARGLASKAIAEALSLSTRTVDNNLQRVFGKLGLAGRRELRGLDLLAVEGTD